jgi:hypothetical protein
VLATHPRSRSRDDRQEARHRARLLSLRDESGQSFVEWLGGLAIMVIVVIAIFAANPSLGGTLRCQAGAQIDRILSIDQEGSCGRPKPKRDDTSKQQHDAQNQADRNAVDGHKPGR